MTGSATIALADERPRSDSDAWATPWKIFRPLHQEFEFTVDAAALASNAKLERFWSPSEDGLRQKWAGERVWINPPYSRIRPWVEKAVADDPDVAVFLLPARIGSDWFHDYVWQSGRALARDRFRVRPLRGRFRFVGARKQPSWDSMLVIYQ